MSDANTPAPRSAALERASRETRREAHELLAAEGSSEQAQRAVESATGQAAQTTAQKDAFAHRWNFGSYLEMFEASKPLMSAGTNWLVTHAGADRWIVWNEKDLTVHYTVRSMQEAQELMSAATDQGGQGTKAPPTG